ncbi:MAG: GxxExxY protein [Chloroflexia bacterium]|nr:GxxExxY protein [Chloroflexia bacterium]
MERDLLTEKIIGCAIEVHRHLGPGLLESAYHRCLVHELKLQTISFRSEIVMPVEYKGVILECGYRIDMLVEEQVILELKSVEKLMGIHAAQLLTYMRLAKIDRGLLINFNATRLIDGVKRYRI